MPDYELERLKSQELEAYHRKKAAWKAYAKIKAELRRVQAAIRVKRNQEYTLS